MTASRAFLVGLAVPIGGSLLLIVAFVVQGFGLVHRREAHPVPALRVAPDDARLARGRHLLRIACSECHAPAGQPDVLSGGDRNLLEVPGGRRWGVLEGPNLTPAGATRMGSDGERSRAIREGIGRDGRALLVHPAAGREGLSEGDLAAILTALRRQTPVERETHRRRLGLLLYMALGTHFVETSVTHPVPWPVPDPAPGANVEHGRYLAQVLACGRCHGRDMDARLRSPLAPPGGDLVRFAREHAPAAFDSALRGGVGPGGRALDRTRMPFEATVALEDDEVGALYAWLRSLSATR